jgi:hypothetical protein
MTPEDQLKLQQLLANAAPEEKDMLEERIANLASLPPDQQAEAIAQLTMDYEGREKTLRGELEDNYALMTQQGPQGGMAGNNPYSVYVGANPLEHLASGIQKYQGGKGVRESREAIEGLSKSKEAGMASVARGMLGEQSAQADILRSSLPKQPWETEEQYLRRTGGRVNT